MDTDTAPQIPPNILPIEYYINSIISRKTLSNCQMSAFFCISIISTIVCIHHNYTKSPICFENMLNTITIYAFIDLFYANDSSKIHHLAIITLAIYNYFTNLDPVDGVYVYYTILKTEISSIFLALKHWLDKKTFLYYGNLVVFYLLFLKLRIIDFYSVVSPGSQLYIIDKKYSDNYMMSFMFVGSVYILYALNMYWFILMNIIFYKKILPLILENVREKYI